MRPLLSTISSIALALQAGMLAAALEGLDAFVFTAGIGENSVSIARPRIFRKLSWLGIALDRAREQREAAGHISSDPKVALGSM